MTSTREGWEHIEHGMTKKEVQSVMGIPSDTRGKWWVYFSPEEESIREYRLRFFLGRLVETRQSSPLRTPVDFYRAE